MVFLRRTFIQQKDILERVNSILSTSHFREKVNQEKEDERIDEGNDEKIGRENARKSLRKKNNS